MDEPDHLRAGFHGHPTNGYVVAADDLNVKRPSLVSRSCRPSGVTVTACRHFAWFADLARSL